MFFLLVSCLRVATLKGIESTSFISPIPHTLIFQLYDSQGKELLIFEKVFMHEIT